MPSRHAGFARSGVVLLVAALGLVGGFAWWLLRDGAGLDGPPRIEAPRSSTPTELPAPVDAPAIAPTREADAVPAPAPAAAANVLTTRPPPESFTRELSGLRGRLVEEDGTPVAGLPLELLRINVDAVIAAADGGFREMPRELSDPIVGRAESAVDGTFKIADVESSPMMILGVDLGGGRGTARMVEASFERGQTVDLGDIVLSPHVVFLGTVVDDDDHPVAGARVRVVPQLKWPIPPQVLQVGIQDIRTDCAALISVEGIKASVEMPPAMRLLFDRVPLPTTTTEGDGTFRLPGVPAGIVTLLVDKSGFLGTVRVGLPTGREAEHSIGTQRLGRGRSAGGVVMAGKEPLVGAKVRVGAVIPLPFGGGDENLAALGQPAGATDSAGRFALTGLPENGDLLCAVQAHAGDPWQLFGPFAGDAAIAIELPAETTLAIAVQDAANQPVRGVDFRFHEDNPLHEIPFLLPASELRGRVKEVEPGRYVASGLPVGKWRVVARAPGYGIADAKVELPPEGATTVLNLPGAWSLKVKVTDAATGAPVDYAIVAALSSFERTWMVPFTAARTDAAGEATLAALPVGAEMRLRTTHPGYSLTVTPLPSDARAHAAAAGDVALPIALLRGGDLVGRVLTNGEPPASPLMLVLQTSGRDEVPEQDMPHFGLTDADGTFRVRHLSAGKWRYNVFGRFLNVTPLALIERLDNEPEELASGSVDIVEGQETRLDIEALPDVPMVPAIVHGEVRVDGERVADAQVQLQGRRWKQTQTDAHGAFRFEDVRPGDYQLTVTRATERGSSTLHREKLTLRPSETREVRVDSRPLRRAVRVVDGSGAGIHQATVYCGRTVKPGDTEIQDYDPYSTNANTDEQGRCTLDVLPGAYTLMVQAKGYVGGKGKIDTQGSDDEVVVTLRRGIRLAGRVTARDATADDRAQRRWHLSLQPLEQDGEGAWWGDWSEVDPTTGKFELSGLQAGSHRAMLWLPNGGEMKQVEIMVPSSDRDDFEIEFKFH